MLLSGLSGNEFINIQKTYLEVYTLQITIGGLNVSALGYYENSLNAIKDALSVNLELKEEEMIRTFSYDYNEEYSSPIIGKGLSGGTKLSTVPNFTGSTVSYAEEWAANNGITLGKEFLTCGTGTPGLIGNQSVPAGTLTKNISYMTIYISQACETNSNENADDDTNNNNTTDNKDVTDIVPGLSTNNNEEQDSNDTSNEVNSSTNENTDE